MNAVVGPDGVVWRAGTHGVRNFNEGDAFPDQFLQDFFYQPMSELYTYIIQLFSDWPSIYNGISPQQEGMTITSWYRNPGRQRIAEQMAGQGRTLSSHLLGLAFDIYHPDGEGAYLTMGSHADNYWGGPAIITTDEFGNVTGSDPRGAIQAGRIDGYWTADYSEKDLHFHIQRWTGHTQDWSAWVAALSSDAPQYLG